MEQLPPMGIESLEVLLQEFGEHEKQLAAAIAGLWKGAINLLEKDMDAGFKMHQKITDFSQILREKYPDTHQNYLGFHLLINSGIPKGKRFAKFDFPNQEIETFIQENFDQKNR